MATITLSNELDNLLDSLVARFGKTKEFHVQEAIIRYMEDIEDIADAEQALADIRSGKSQVISYEEMKRRLELDSNS